MWGDRVEIGGNKYFITFIRVRNIPEGDGGWEVSGMSTSETYSKSRTPWVRGAPRKNT